MIKKYIIAFVTCLFSVSMFAQQIPQSFKGKTHMMNKEEMLKLNTIGKDFIETAPPVGKLRSIAEFERTEGIIVTYLSISWGSYFGIPISLIAEISEDALVYTVVSNETAENEVTATYATNGVNMDNVVFVYGQADSYWARDYSPWFIANENEVAIVNFPYNRPRPNDDNMPNVFGDHLGLEVYGMNLVSTGGNYMSDGMGVAASCDLVYDENPSLTVQQVADLALNYLGVETYYLVADPLDDYIEHIDCWGKFLDVDKILIAEVAKDDPRYNDFEEMADYWENQTSSYGNNYEVYRVFSPNGQPYTNSLILNNKVLVPIVTGYGSSYNEQALEVYRSAMPGYEVIGFEQNPYATWESTDALHCRTHEVPDLEMLYIKHLAKFDTLPNSTVSVEFTADITSYGNNDIEEAKLVYKLNDADFIEVDLIAEAKGENTYQTVIDNILPGDSIAYYILASDASGRTETHPFIGEDDPHKFYIETTTTRIDTDEFILDADIYPNPAKESITIDFDANYTKDLNVIIVDVNGRKVLEYNKSNSSGLKNQKLDVSYLESGIYFIKINSGQYKCNKKLIIQ